MSLLSNVRRWIAHPEAGADAAAAAGAPQSLPFNGSSDDTSSRRARPEVLRVILGVVLRDVQLRAALNKDWIDLEVLDASSALHGSHRLHARLVLRVWAPRVLANAAQLERLFIDRLRELDPQSPRWFAGLSWRLDLPPGQTFGSLPGPWEWEPATRH